MSHVALNLLYLDPGRTGGMETVARELLPELLRVLPGGWRLSCIVNRNAAADRSGPWHEVPLHVVDVDVASRPAWVRAELTAVPRAARALGADLVHSLGNVGPWRAPMRHSVTVHDLIHHRVPAPGLNVKGRITGALVTGAARRADRVIVIAGQTRDDLIEIAKVPAERIDLVPNGVADPAVAPTPEAELRARHALGDRPLLLSPSARQPHKNLDRLLQAHALLPAPRPVLVVPGYPTGHGDALAARTRELGIDDDVRWLGWIEQADLEGFFACAAGLVFPSLYEGFGLPVLEAMARGLPVACSDRGSLREVAGDAALIFDPESPRAIADATARLLADASLRARLIDAGRTQAARYRWPASAAGYIASFRRTLAG